MLRLLLALSSEREKIIQPHQLAGIDRVTPYQDDVTPTNFKCGKSLKRMYERIWRIYEEHDTSREPGELLRAPW
jgi:hypothetical protein